MLHPLPRLCLLGVLGSCAAPRPDPYFNDAELIRFGVDYQDEAQALSKSYAEAGYHVESRIVGQHFAALCFVGPSGTSRSVRVITRRGVALALDSIPKGALSDRLEYHLVLPPMQDTLDADQDGFEELFVQEVGHAGGPCVTLYRVRDSGFVDPVKIDLSRFGTGACVRDVRDGDGNDQVELVVDYTVEGLPLPRWPRVEVLLFPDRAHGFTPWKGPPELMERYYGQVLVEREPAMAEAVDLDNAPEVYRLAVELTLAVHMLGADPPTERKWLSTYFEQLSPPHRNAAIEAAIMARIEEGW